MWFRTNGPVVQWIEYKIPVLTIWVRIPSGSRRLPDRSSGRGFFFFRPLRSPRPKAAVVPHARTSRTKADLAPHTKAAPYAEVALREHTPKPPSENAIQHSSRRPAYAAVSPSEKPLEPAKCQKTPRKNQKTKKRHLPLPTYKCFFVSLFSIDTEPPCNRAQKPARGGSRRQRQQYPLFIN